MTDKPVKLDEHRGMAAQKATDLRRLLAEVAANEQALRAAQDALEAQLIAAPASNWQEAADKVRYAVGACSYSERTRPAQEDIDPSGVLDDFSRLAGEI
jgi:hypothetical protein